MMICDRCKKPEGECGETWEGLTVEMLDCEGNAAHTTKSIELGDLCDACLLEVWQAVQAAIDKAMEGGSDATPN